jgi:hypothetical protein
MTTTTEQRRAGKLGLRAPKRGAALAFARIWSGRVPAHPAAEDSLARLGGGWQMLGNDRAGVCAPVTWANFRRLVTAICGGAEHYPTQEQVYDLYRTQNPRFDPDGDENSNGPGSEADGGMDLQTLLEHLVEHGGPDGVRAVAFARVNPHDTAEVKAALAIFGALWTGVMVQEANQQQFEDGRPWDYERSSPDEGGHSVLTGGYGAPGGGPLGGDERFITWAEETSFTDRYFGREVDELYAVIWPEHLEHPAFLAGIDRQALIAAFNQITGKELAADVQAKLTAAA